MKAIAIILILINIALGIFSKLQIIPFEINLFYWGVWGWMCSLMLLTISKRR
jgi:hypothetical protein